MMASYGQLPFKKIRAASQFVTNWQFYSHDHVLQESAFPLFIHILNPLSTHLHDKTKYYEVH